MPSIVNSKDIYAKHIKNHISGTTKTLNIIISELTTPIYNTVNLIIDTFNHDGKLLLAGNGGSAADAQHFTAEMIVRLNADSKRPALPAIALSTDSSILTAASNDFGFEHIYRRQLEGLAKTNDCFVAISTSGNSSNLIEALKHTKKYKIKSIGLLGNDGGKMKELVDMPIIVKSNNTMHIQEAHICIYHLICDLVERSMF